MVPQPAQIATTQEIQGSKPRLGWNRQEKPSRTQLGQSPEGAARVRQMFQHLRGNHQIESTARFRPVKEIGAFKALVRVLRPGCLQGIFSQIETDVVVKNNPPSHHFSQEQPLPTTELEHRFRLQKNDFGGDPVEEPPEHETVNRILVSVLPQVPFGRIVSNRRERLQTSSSIVCSACGTSKPTRSNMIADSDL